MFAKESLQFGVVMRESGRRQDDFGFVVEKTRYDPKALNR